MTSSIRITRHPYEEPHSLNLVVQAATRGHSAEIEIYAKTTDLVAAADALEAFPAKGSEFRWLLGSERPEDRFAFYFMLRVWQVRASGLCAVGIRFNNNEEPPDRRIAEFSFLAYPADVDRLGRRFRNFSRLVDLEMEWVVAEDGSS